MESVIERPAGAEVEIVLANHDRDFELHRDKA